MPPLIGIWIELDNPVKAYFPGQVVSGRVVIDSEKPTATTGLKIKLDGKVKVKWPERASRKDSSGSRKIVTVFYTADESYFQHEEFLVGDGKTSSVIARGNTAYKFQYTLPNDLPSSFVSRSGTVSYIMEASLMLPHNRSDATCMLPFTVNGILDLNVEPGASLSVETRKYKSMYCLCCTSGPVGFLFKLARKGFVPGEILEFIVELSNQSSQRVYGMKVTLMQVVKFHAEGNSKTIIRPIRQLQGPEVEPGESEIWVEKMLKIPPIPPTRLATCRIIDVQYNLKLELALPNISLNLKDEVPIIIGTIPLRNTFANLAASTLTLAPTAPENESIEAVERPSYLEIPPNNEGPDERGDIGGKANKGGRTRGMSVSSEAPSFLEYPDLPPPSYKEAVQMDKSPDACEENPAFSPDELTASTLRSVNSSQYGGRSGATTVNFVPQYVTYGMVDYTQ
ncbi:Arrestin domain-containing protein 3 [Orchesella cincta]|uniref:Arrestin domain-containing protein 3 n=1 Tax=Orchesella cincta TaxID=48709 RepID=A0A1D2MJ73_ORCCI|nr:Arrestin domain-containing protein 3 [Orchesella cincta]